MGHSNAWVASRFGHPSVVVKEMYTSPACPSSLAGNRQKASVIGLTLLQPRSKVLGKHLVMPVPCVRHLGNSRCVLLINCGSNRDQKCAINN